MSVATIVRGTDGKVYKVVNGTYYHEQTQDDVISWLETFRGRGQRIRVFYGDTSTGRDWMEEHDTIGTVGRSTGSVKIPLLIANSRSHGGGAILTQCIVHITTKDSAGILRDVYRRPNYRQQTFHIHRLDTDTERWAAYKDVGGDYFDPSPYVIFPNKERAQGWIEFISGRRNAK